VEVKSPQSYMIDMGDDNIRHIHANKIRRFVARISECAVINDSDIEFGSVMFPGADATTTLPSSTVADKLDHLQPGQRQKFMKLLDEFSDCFADTPRFCDVVTHRIQTTSELTPRQMRPYRVPETMKPEVDRQIDELLKLGLIRPSTSPMASPIVCVSKKDDGVRIACDYRYLNSYTVGGAYLMSTVNETLLKLGAADFISTFDAKSGYWQIPVAESDQWNCVCYTQRVK